MTVDEITKFASKQATRLMSGNLDAFLSRFDMPVPFYSPVDINLLTSQDELRILMKQYLRALKGLDVQSLKPISVDIEERNESRCRVRLDWDHIDAGGKSIFINTSMFVLRYDPSEPEPKIELIEYGELSINSRAKRVWLPQ